MARFVQGFGICLLLGITACAAPVVPAAPTATPSSPTPTMGAVASPTPAGGPPRVMIQSFAFHPAELEVAVGTTVEWVNQEEAVPHTVTSGSPDQPSGVFDSGRLQPGDSFRFTFNQPGTYEYFCSIHTRMRGRIVVKPAPASGYDY
ncbi:MAG TPA: cupredoxin family copper-binding protein [Thermoflexus sp.]|nr:cupredoxin family copper-binding protein [Thermoflexus sp.]